MNLAFSAEEEAFREEVREFLKDYLDLDAFFGQGHKWDRVRELFCAMGERGWLSLTWPKRWGGLEKGLVHEYLLWEEVAYARAARNPLSAGIVAKSILRYGTDEQRSAWLPRIRTGDIHFSLAYSEPEAGSDLASLRCRADLRGDRYVVNGEKCWQSYAQDMDYLWLLCRTGSQESRGAGLTVLIADIDSPGLKVGALPTLDGDQLNEIHFEDVEVPVANRVGPENGAWKMIGEALEDERHIQFPPGRVRRDYEEMLGWLREHELDGDPIVRHRMADLAVDVMEVEITALRVLDTMRKGIPALEAVSSNKVIHTEASQKIARAVLELGGPEAIVASARPQLLWRQSLWETIGGGTSEIMRGLVAKSALGLSGRR